VCKRIAQFQFDATIECKEKLQATQQPVINNIEFAENLLYTGLEFA